MGGESFVRRVAPVTGDHNWPEMVRLIREEGSPEAALDFKNRYRQGILVLLRRQLGAVGLLQLVDEVLDGAVREIATGRIATAADLLHFLRNVAEREMLIRNIDPGRSLLALASATDHRRHGEESELMRAALATFEENERQALRGYYDGELTAEQAAVSAGLTREGFPRLRERLYEAVRLAGLRQAARSEGQQAAGMRAMAAGSGRLA